MKQEKWRVQGKKADFERIGKEFGISPIVARLIRNRDLTEAEEIRQYLNGGLDDLNDPMLLPDMEAAAGLLEEKIASGKAIRIIGDYDIDGVCSIYILYRGLKELGARADWRIPHRVQDGYGLNVRLVEEAAADQIDTLLTCDNGIAAIEQIARARELGMAVVVTDHHEVQAELPAADAVVNPKRADNQYPFPGICGAVVAWKLVTVLFARRGMEEKAKDYLEFAALATVGDVMSLQGENRIIVREGLKKLRCTANPGLRALMDCSGILPENLSAYHLGFVIGPCLNAGGRLDTAKRAVEVLLAGEEEAPVLARGLRELNEERKDMTLRGLEQAVGIIEQSSLLRDPVLVVFLPDCHESLAGIIAGRLRERYSRPAFVLTRTEEGLKGSGRSIPAYHMFEGLNRCGELLTKFGGHPMAAGLSLKEENLEELRKRLNQECGLGEEDLVPTVWIDMELPFLYATEELTEQCRLLEPFGNGNEKPVFAARNVQVNRMSRIGKSRNMLKLSLSDASGAELEGLFFGDGDAFCVYYGEKFGGEEVEKAFRGDRNSLRLMVAYYPDINCYQGRRRIQIVIQRYL